MASCPAAPARFRPGSRSSTAMHALRIAVIVLPSFNRDEQVEKRLFIIE
jgi:hypothetical protein